MQLKVVVENMTVKQGLLAEWGYSVWLEAGQKSILLDTGGIEHVLMHNLQFLGLDASTITDVVLSHGHFDHTSGLFDVLRMAPQAHVWASQNIARERWSEADAHRFSGGGSMLTGLKFTSVEPYRDIAPGVTAITVPAEYRDPRWVSVRNMFEKDSCGCPVSDSHADDLSLLIRTQKGASLVLGCAHAGLPNIMRYVKETFNIDSFDTVLGGTHLCSVTPQTCELWMQELAKYKVRHWRPCHCTGFYAAAQLARHFDDVEWAAAGTVHEL